MEMMTVTARLLRFSSFNAIALIALLTTQSCKKQSHKEFHGNSANPITITLTRDCDDTPPQKQCMVRLPTRLEIQEEPFGESVFEEAVGNMGATVKCEIGNGRLSVTFLWNSESIPESTMYRSCLVYGVEIPLVIEPAK